VAGRAAEPTTRRVASAAAVSIHQERVPNKLLHDRPVKQVVISFGRIIPRLTDGRPSQAHRPNHALESVFVSPSRVRLAGVTAQGRARSPYSPSKVMARFEASVGRQEAGGTSAAF